MTSSEVIGAEEGRGEPGRLGEKPPTSLEVLEKRLECASSHTPFLQLTNAGCREAEGSVQARGPSMGKGPEVRESLHLQRTEKRLMCLGCRVKGCRWERRLADGLETLPLRSLAFVQDHWEAMKDFQQENDRVKLKH